MSGETRDDLAGQVAGRQPAPNGAEDRWDTGDLTSILQCQVGHLGLHLQIADAKAAGTLAYCVVLSGATAGMDKLANIPYGWTWAVALMASGLSVAIAFWAILPRLWPGQDPSDSFSWFGVSHPRRAIRYTEELRALSIDDMLAGMADHIEATAHIVRRKYRLVQTAILLALLSSGLHCFVWYLVSTVAVVANHG